MAQKRDKRTANLKPQVAETPILSPGVTFVPMPMSPVEEELPAWVWPLSLGFGCFFFYLTVRFVLLWVQANEQLVRDALSHLLRPRK